MSVCHNSDLTLSATADERIESKMEPTKHSHDKRSVFNNSCDFCMHSMVARLQLAWNYYHVLPWVIKAFSYVRNYLFKFEEQLIVTINVVFHN